MGVTDFIASSLNELAVPKAEAQPSDSLTVRKESVPQRLEAKQVLLYCLFDGGLIACSADRTGKWNIVGITEVLLQID